MKIENSWQINKVICILLESYFFPFFFFHLQRIYFVIYKFTWTLFDLSFFMQHRESQKELNVSVQQPINGNFKASCIIFLLNCFVQRSHAQLD